MTPEEVQYWHEKYTLLLNKELYEALDETEFKPHRAIKGKMVRSNMAEELIDVFKYWMCLCQVHGFTVNDVVDEYHRKSNVVKQRFFQEKIMSFDGKIAGIDIDGVLGDYPRSFVEFINEQLGTTYDYRTVKSYDVGAALGLPPEVSASLKHMYRETGQKRFIPVIEGAKQFLDELKYMGYIVVLLTSRPYQQYKRIYGDTQYWLAEGKLQYDAILWDERKGERLIQEFGRDKVEFFVDDVGNFANGISDAGMKCYLINKPYNEDIQIKKNVCRVNNLREVLDIIKEGGFEV
jgi:uncharacterized HAD superfamily protein/NTP pyrophosphatase (non-canonical NTP hydrolase)